MILCGAINPFPAKLFYSNFHPLEVVSRYRDTQLQVAENYSYLFNLSSDIYKYYIPVICLTNKTD